MLQLNYFMPNLLKSKKISETPFRKEVLAIFDKHNNAIPLSVVEKELKKFNRITLYRTIKVFLEKGIIHEITITELYLIMLFAKMNAIQFHTNISIFILNVQIVI